MSGKQGSIATVTAGGLIAAAVFMFVFVAAGLGSQAGLAGSARDGASAMPTAKSAAPLPAGMLLGDGAVETSHAYARPGVAEAFHFGAIATGSATVAHVFIGKGNTAKLLYVGLYGSVSDRPGKLLGVGAAEHPSSGAWIAVPLAGVGLEQGRHYWLAILARGGTLHYRERRRQACLSATSSQTNLHTLRKSWSGHRRRSGCPLSAYVTETPTYLVAPSIPVAPAPPHAPAEPRSCFADPEGCGYPGPNDAGVANCSALTPSGSLAIMQPGTIEGYDITGKVTVYAANVTLNHDCVQTNANEESGSTAVTLESSAAGFALSNSTVRGLNSTSESVEAAVRNGSNTDLGAVLTNDRIEHCGTCFLYAMTVNESYVVANGMEIKDEGVEHSEDWYLSDSTIGANHDTIYNPSKQTAVIFAQTGGTCEDRETVTNSLIAGGGYTFYFCAHATGAGSSSIDIKNNRFARLICTHKEISDYEGLGGFGCTGSHGGYFESGEGSGGFFPRGGFFGLVYEGEGLHDVQSVEWEGNYWDNNLEAQPEKAYCPKCG